MQQRHGVGALGVVEYATAQMKPIPGVRLVGTAADKASVLSFVLKSYTTTVRPSLAFYNTCEEIDRMVAVVRRLAR
jgi:cysteine desulfurase/selenocysteine lyase